MPLDILTKAHDEVETVRHELDADVFESIDGAIPFIEARVRKGYCATHKFAKESLAATEKELITLHYTHGVISWTTNLCTKAKKKLKNDEKTFCELVDSEIAGLRAFYIKVARVGNKDFFRRA